MIKAIKIDVANLAITEIEMEDTLPSFYQQIGCTVMEAARPDWFEGNVLLVDENGLRDAHTKGAFRIKGWPHLIIGNGVIVSYDEEGETRDHDLELEDVQKAVTWLVPI